MTELKHRINLVIGDWSGDGHRETDRETWFCNKSLAEVEAAYAQGSTILGFDLIYDYCCDYEDNWLPTLLFWRIVELCPNFDEDWELEGELTPEEEEFRQINSNDEWVGLVLAVAKIGDPELVFKASPHEFSWKIGGYGFYT